MSAIDDGGSMVCPVHGTRTRITCVVCGRPICPEEATPSPVGLTCGQHPQRSVRFVRWTPAGGPPRSVMLPVGLILISTLAVGYAARASASFFVTLDRTHPWLGIGLFVVLIAAVLAALFYWLVPRA